MKYRICFVSNSSSTSFLVAFLRNPKNAKDVQGMVFGDIKQFVHPYVSVIYTAEEIAQAIWDDIKKQIPNNRNMIFSRMHNVIRDRYSEFETPAKDPQYPGDYDFDDEGFRCVNKETILEFMSNNDGCFFYCFEYSDNGEGQRSAAMEHGDLFADIPHLTSSNH